VSVPECVCEQQQRQHDQLPCSAPVLLHKTHQRRTNPVCSTLGFGHNQAQEHFDHSAILRGRMWTTSSARTLSAIALATQWSIQSTLPPPDSTKPVLTWVQLRLILARFLLEARVQSRCFPHQCNCQEGTDGSFLMFGCPCRAKNWRLTSRQTRLIRWQDKVLVRLSLSQSDCNHSSNLECHGQK